MIALPNSVAALEEQKPQTDVGHRNSRQGPAQETVELGVHGDMPTRSIPSQVSVHSCSMGMCEWSGEVVVRDFDLKSFIVFPRVM